MTKQPAATKSYATKSPGQVLAEQKLAAGRARAAAQKKPESNGSTAVAPAAKTTVAMPDTTDPIAAYLAEIAPSSIVGRMVKFDPGPGTFVTPDDDGKIEDSVDFVVLCDQTLVGWIKFNGKGEPPTRHMGLLYDGFAMPPRDSLGDMDEDEWPDGLSGKPEDPWKHQMYLVLQQAGTTELFTFVTPSKTGRRAVGSLLQHYKRMQKANPNEFPVVRLKKGGYQDKVHGWVNTPVFAVVGRAPRDSVAKPDTSPGGDMNDEIPYSL